MNGAADSLALDGAFADAALVQNLQASFGIHLPFEETQTWYFVGDIYRSLVYRMDPAQDDGRASASAIAFYYLRRAILSIVPDEEITPSTRLSRLERFQVRRFLKLVSERSMLRLPDHDGSWLGWGAVIGCLLATIGFGFGIPPFPSAVGYAFLSLSLAAVLPLFDPGRFPSGCRTVGDLAEKAAGLNYAKLRGDGAAADGRAIWRALVAVLSEHTAVPPKQITPETRLLPPAA